MYTVFGREKFSNGTNRYKKSINLKENFDNLSTIHECFIPPVFSAMYYLLNQTLYLTCTPVCIYNLPHAEGEFLEKLHCIYCVATV